MVSVVVVSTSEIQKVIKGFDSSYEFTHPEEFKKLLWNLGLNIYQPYERQEGLEHRNRFGEVVNCPRWVGVERLDNNWITSGYASREAKLEASGSKMVRDLDPHKYHDL